MEKKQLVPIEFRAKPTPEVEKKLRRLKIYTRVMKNIREVPYPSGREQRKAFEIASKTHCSSEFINWAFIWDNTPEGWSYWHAIYIKLPVV